MAKGDTSSSVYSRIAAFWFNRQFCTGPVQKYGISSRGPRTMALGTAKGRRTGFRLSQPQGRLGTNAVRCEWQCKGLGSL